MTLANFLFSASLITAMAAVYVFLVADDAIFRRWAILPVGLAAIGLWIAWCLVVGANPYLAASVALSALVLLSYVFLPGGSLRTAMGALWLALAIVTGIFAALMVAQALGVW